MNWRAKWQLGRAQWRHDARNDAYGGPALPVVSGGSSRNMLPLLDCWLAAGCYAPDPAFDQKKFNARCQKSAELFCRGLSPEEFAVDPCRKVLTVATVMDHLRLALRSGYKDLVTYKNGSLTCL